MEQQEQSTAAILNRLERVARMVDPLPLGVPASLRHPDDVHVLACAIAAGADAIVKGDNDLLVLGSFQGIPIIRVEEALKRLGLAMDTGHGPARSARWSPDGRFIV